MQFAHGQCLSIPPFTVSNDLPAVYIRRLLLSVCLPVVAFHHRLCWPSFTSCCNAHVTPSTSPPPAPFRDAKSVDSLACQREKKRLNGCSKAQTTLTSRPSCLCRLLLKHCLHSLRQRDSLLAQSLVSYFRWAPNNAPRPSGSLDNARAAKNTPRKQQKKGQKASIDACEYGCQVCYCWLRTAPGRSCNAALLPALPLRLTLLRGRDVVLALRSPIQPVPCNLNLVYLAQCLRIRRCIFSLEQNKLTSLICLKSVRSLISHIKNNS